MAKEARKEVFKEALKEALKEVRKAAKEAKAKARATRPMRGPTRRPFPSVPALLDRRLTLRAVPSQEVLQELADHGVLRDGDLDESITQELAGLAPEHSMEAALQFAGSILNGGINNKAGFLIGILRRMQIDYGLPKGGWNGTPQ